MPKTPSSFEDAIVMYDRAADAAYICEYLVTVEHPTPSRYADLRQPGYPIRALSRFAIRASGAKLPRTPFVARVLNLLEGLFSPAIRVLEHIRPVRSSAVHDEPRRRDL
jgi:hypothetical protein